MKESEWKKFKKLKDKCLERYCSAVLEEAQELCNLSDKSNHERYIDLYQLMRNRDKELGRAFDGLSRSKAHPQLLMMYRMGLVEENELDVLSEYYKEYLINFKENSENADKLLTAGQFSLADSDPVGTAALMMVAQVLYNLDETITKE